MFISLKFFSMLLYKTMGEVGCLKDGCFQNVHVQGSLTHGLGKKLFSWTYNSHTPPTFSHAQSADTTSAAGESVAMTFPDIAQRAQHIILMHIGAITAALETPKVEGTLAATDTGDTVAGLNMQLDQDTAADLGWEMGFGHYLGTGHCGFTVGTDSGFIDVTLICAEWTTYDAVSVGFRKAEAPHIGHAPIVAAGTGDPVYTDFATFGIQESDKIQICTRVNDTGLTGIYTDTGLTPTNSESVRFRVTLAVDGSVTYSLVQNAIANGGALVAAANAVAFSFDSGDTVVPYFFAHGKDHADTPLLLKHLEIHQDQQRHQTPFI
jgi:hypothetical protein